jgi:LysR family transcriptional regulator, hydrogen peroxide-inducible genes activator
MHVLDPLPCSLRQLQYLVAVADLGGFSRAAARCHVSQPSLSAQVALAEAALGVRVFERDRRGVRVSPAGAVVLERARQVLLAANDLASTARQQADPFTGTIRVGVIPTVCPYLLPEITPALREKFPRLTILWTEEKTPTLVERIMAGDLDGAILARDTKAAGLEFLEIGRDAFVVASAPDHPLMRSARPLTPAALEGAEVLLLEDGHCLRDQALALCARAGATEAGYRATSLATLVQMVVSHSGVTLLPSLAVPVENRTGQLATRRFAEPGPARTLALAWRRGSALQTTIEAVGRTVRKCYGMILGTRITRSRDGVS